MGGRGWSPARGRFKILQTNSKRKRGTVNASVSFSSLALRVSMETASTGVLLQSIIFVIRHLALLGWHSPLREIILSMVWRLSCRRIRRHWSRWDECRNTARRQQGRLPAESGRRPTTARDQTVSGCRESRAS